MKYTFPNSFSLTRAQELATLVNSAYDQLDHGPTYPPANYTILATLTAKEPWKGFESLPNFIGPVAPVLFGFVAQKGTDLYVVIRGTKTPLEWLDDFTASPIAFAPSGQNWGQITKGFSLIYSDLGPQIIAALNTYKNGGGSLNSIFVTGHSLGAALAHVAAAGINAQFGVQPISYTYSGPRAGDSVFAAKYASAQLTAWRMVNTEDIVPTVPPAAVQMTAPNMGMHGLTPIPQALSSFVLLHAIGYNHVGYPIAVTFHKDTVADNHDMNALVAEAAS